METRPVRQKDAIPRGVEKLRWAWGRIKVYASGPLAPPPESASWELFLYGVAQPMLGARMILRERSLLIAAAKPVLLLAVFCALVAFREPAEGAYGYVRRFFQTFVVLAPVPPTILEGHYRRLAARAHGLYGFGPCSAIPKGIFRALWEALLQVIVIAVGLLPLTGPISLVPGLGLWLIGGITALWAMHWIMVEALDNSRVSIPGQEPLPERLLIPWFVQFYYETSLKLPRGLRWAGLRYTGICDRLARPWREEIYLIKTNPVLFTGMSITTALLLALPGINLLFRPIVVVACSHALCQIGRGTPLGEENEKASCASSEGQGELQE